MQVTRTFTTTSSPKYLKSRTVSLPVELVEYASSGDRINVVIKTQRAGDIVFSVTGDQVKRHAEAKTKDGNKFYVLKY